jgi:hypothetical protein
MSSEENEGMQTRTLKIEAGKGRRMDTIWSPEKNKGLAGLTNPVIYFGVPNEI